MTNNLTVEEVRKAVADVVADIISDYKDEPDTDRETLIERMDEETDTLFGQLVSSGRIEEYDVDDLIRTAGPCAVVLKVAQEDADVEDDSGLWDGLTFGVLASIAYFSLRNLIYTALKEAGHDSNDDEPFTKEEVEAED